MERSVADKGRAGGTLVSSEANSTGRTTTNSQVTPTGAAKDWQMPQVLESCS